MGFEFYDNESNYKAPEMSESALRDFRRKLGKTALFLAK